MVFLVLTPLVAGCLTTDEQMQAIEQEEAIVTEETITTDEPDEPDEPMEQEETSVDEETVEAVELMSFEVDFTFDLQRTAANPLRGFYTNCLLYTSPSPRDH